jgi:hypothetical protein
VDEFFSIYVILLAVLGPGVQSACNRNEYQRPKIIFLGVERGRPTTLSPSVNRLSNNVCDL